MKKFKKWLWLSSMASLLIVLSGCVATYKDTADGHIAGQPTGDGWVYNFLVRPMSNGINFLVNHFDWNYGVAIIVITVVVRIIIMPLGLYQSKKTMIQTEKTAFLKPQIDVIQQKMKSATTQEEKLAANAELQNLYKENNMSMFGGLGCLPLLIQMPIFTALFYAAKFTPGINESTFLGVHLGSPSILFVILAGLSYLAQGFIGMIGVSEEQKKTMKTMIFMSPLMIVFLSFNAPAGVTLYWIVGGVFSCIQTLITNLYHKPIIKAAIAEELRQNPPKVVVPIVEEPVQNVTETPAIEKQPDEQPQKRNAGKQQRKN